MPVSTGAQRLKITHFNDGSAAGHLQCSIALGLSREHVMVVEDCVADVAVGMVLNPLKGVFLADEVQRLMRLGLADWLRKEVCVERINHILTTPDATVQTVQFTLSGVHGSQCDVSVDVDVNLAGDAVPAAAMASIHAWCHALAAHEPAAWVREELEQADLSLAPLVRSGLAQTRLIV